MPVLKVKDFAGTKYVERDFAPVTVGVSAGSRSEVIEIVNLFRGKIVDIAKNSLVIELSGPEEKVEGAD